jgi:hypothetical protein
MRARNGVEEEYKGQQNNVRPADVVKLGIRRINE